MMLILGGTTEGRAAVRVADEAGSPYFYSTKGSLQTIECAHGTRLSGALDEEGMARLCREKGIRLIIDAAHPFAAALHQTIGAVARRLDIPVIRYERRYPPRDPALTWCADYPEAIRRLEAAEIRRLLTLSGVNTIAPLRPYWSAHPEGWFRVLDREESIAAAVRQGYPRERLVFYEEGGDEMALLRRLRPDAILTKESGFSGFFPEKVEAAKRYGIPVFVVMRPALPETFYLVYGEEGLRKRIERWLPDFFPLRSGYTTGACATAAARAAAWMLRHGEPLTACEITLPSGETVTLPIFSTTQTDDSVSCQVIKEAGDDPDATNHAAITATVRFIKPLPPDFPKERIRFLAGEGVGTVTLPGLGLAVGDPAINATPRRMMRDELLPLLPDGETGAEVRISVPGGAEIARRTFNPKLGIVGGISIIGTSGIVRPFSTDAFIASIRKEASVARAIGCETLVINSGAKSEAYLKRRFPDLPPQAFVHYGNFIGETLRIAAEMGFAEVVLGIMIGKAVKLAEGSLDTHSKKTVMNKDFLRSLAAESGCSSETLGRIDRITLARELWTTLTTGELDRFLPTLIRRCAAVCAPLLPQGRLTLLLITEEGEVIG